MITRSFEKDEAAKDTNILFDMSYCITLFNERAGSEQLWAGTGTSPVSVPQVNIHYLEKLEALQHLYVFRGERARLVQFLEKNPFLVPLLLETFWVIEKFFPHSLVHLALTTDPEEFGTDQLVAFIATDLGPDEAIEALDKFDKKWWLNALQRTQGKFVVTLEFR
ncbi:MAG TPA: hypothetical protein VNG51_19040 [Ktedonobacteraceae bacterium]|nr:hypothetical protein [Ktedonobacteraceae bacterium]